MKGASDKMFPHPETNRRPKNTVLKIVEYMARRVFYFGKLVLFDTSAFAKLVGGLFAAATSIQLRRYNHF